MSKLEDYAEDAKGHNIAEEGYEYGKDKAKDAVQDKVKNVGKDAVESAANKVGGGLKKAHKGLASKSNVYGKGTEVIAGGAKKVAGGAKKAASGLKAGAQAVGAFVKSGPVGWGVGAVSVILLIILVGGDGGEDYANGAYTEDDIVLDEAGHELTEEERILLLDGVFCPEPVYAGSVDPSSGSGSSDLSDTNSIYHQNAKRVFDQWVGAGFTGEAAAGIVGWVSSEGGFHMIGRAEGYYSSHDPKDASIAYGNEPIPSLSSYKVGGGGIYQITPYTEYAPLGSPDWEDFEKMHAFVFNRLANEGHWMPQNGNDLSGKKHTLIEFASSTNIEDTTLAWNSYERMNQGVWRDQFPGIKNKKVNEAKLAYEVFNGSQYKFDERAFNAHFGDDSDYSRDVDNSYTDPCTPTYMGGSPWGGNGGQPTIKSGMWAHNEVPNELKQYAINPQSVGLENGVANTWEWNTSSSHDQCTDLTSNLIKLIWQKDGNPFPTTTGMGNGREVAPSYARMYGGKITNKPSAGAIFSTSTGNAMCGGAKCGHTGVVSHVFDNGDFLVIEQNVGRLSGMSAGQKNTFNYRIIAQKNIAEGSYTFYDPSTVGYQFVEGIKSL